MAMELVTGYAGKAHVTSYQDAAIQAGIVGVDNGVLSYVGQGMKAVATSANNIRIYDGVALIGGKAVVIDRDTYQDVAIANGTVGKYRNDIIYIKYTKDAFTGVESVTFDVKQGAAGNSGIDPALTTNNLYSTGTLTSEIPFKRVRLNGLAIESVENMHDNVPSLSELNRKLFLDGYFFVDFGSLPNSTTKLVDTDIPNTATHYWIDAGWAKTRGGNGSYTLPYIDPNNWNNSIRVLLNANRQIEVTTTTDWSGYPAYFIVAYKL